jgi:hypothetical protein
MLSYKTISSNMLDLDLQKAGIHKGERWKRPCKNMCVPAACGSRPASVAGSWLPRPAGKPKVTAASAPPAPSSSSFPAAASFFPGLLLLLPSRRAPSISGRAEEAVAASSLPVAPSISSCTEEATVPRRQSRRVPPSPESHRVEVAAAGSRERGAQATESRSSATGSRSSTAGSRSYALDRDLHHRIEDLRHFVNQHQALDVPELSASLRRDAALYLLKLNAHAPRKGCGGRRTPSTPLAGSGDGRVEGPPLLCVAAAGCRLERERRGAGGDAGGWTWGVRSKERETGESPRNAARGRHSLILQKVMRQPLEE